MASANALPRIRKHETDSNTAGGDSSRYGSSRDYYVSCQNPWESRIELTFFPPFSLLGMTAVETENGEIEEEENANTNVVETGDDLDLRMVDEEKEM